MVLIPSLTFMRDGALKTEYLLNVNVYYLLNKHDEKRIFNFRLSNTIAQF